jgi:cation diffusion facilitator family transporter
LETTVQNNLHKEKINVALTSIGAAVIIITVKIIATVQTGSLAILSELFHSSTDFLASLVTLISIKYSVKPPDRKHNYGHEKIESFSALFQVLILIAMCIYIFYEAVERIINKPIITLNLFSFIAIGLCIFLDYSRSKALKRVAKKTNSQALEADALHFSSDIWSSAVVLLSMIMTSLKVSPLFDSISAIIVAVIIIYTSINLTKRAFHSLLDGVPTGTNEMITDEVNKVEEIEKIKSLRIRTSGSKTFVDMTVLISRTLSFTKTHEIIDILESKLESLIPNSDFVIHSEPIETNKESLNEKVRILVNDMGYKCHDIFSHRIDGRIFTELHIEIDNTMDFEKAHSIISNIEAKILKEINLINNVKIHIDEPSEKLYETIDITTQSQDIVFIIDNIFKNVDGVIYSDVKIMETKGKIRISLNCTVQKKMNFDEVHDLITYLENKIYMDVNNYRPNISNVIIHAEPEKIN